MNTTLAPRRPPPTFATADQLAVLQAAFDPRKLRTTAQEIQSLTEETGLSSKWITSWFGRQRRKIKTEEDDSGLLTSAPTSQATTKKVKEKKSMKDKNTAICAPKKPKTKYCEPTLSGPVISTNDDIELLDPPASEKSKKAVRGRPKGSVAKKRKAGAALPEGNSRSRKRPAPARQPTSTLVPNYTSQNQGTSPQDILDISSDSSCFQVAIPAKPQTPVDPSQDAQHLIKPFTIRQVHMPSSTLEQPFNAFENLSNLSMNDDLLVQNYTYSDFAPKIPTSVAAACRRQGTTGAQGGAATEFQAPASVPASFPTSRVVPLSSRPRLLPLTQDYSPANLVPAQYSSSPAPVPAGLTDFASDPLLGLGEIDLSKHWPLFDSPAGKENVQPMLKAAPQTQPFSSVSSEKLLWDPTATPLKHLSVLQPFSTVNTLDGVRAIFDRESTTEALLNDHLVEEDPFQAAMGLVFLRSTGLSW